MIQLIKVCGLPVEQYFNPEIIRGDSEQRQRVSHKLKLCPEHYLPVIEGAIDGALKIEQSAKESGMCENILRFPFCQRAARPSYFFALFCKKTLFCGQLDVLEASYLRRRRNVASIGSVATLPKTGLPLSLRAVAGCLLGKAPNPCSERTVNEWQTEHETLCCASCDAGRTGLDPAENGPAPHEELFRLCPENAH